MKLFLKLLLTLVSTAIFPQIQPPKKNHFQTFGNVIKTSFNSIPNDFVYLGKKFSDD